MEWEVLCDATVTYPDALKWVEPLFNTRPREVIEHALDVEPAVMGVAVDLAVRTVRRLKESGVPEEICVFVFNQMCQAGGITIELMRKGSAQLWSDLIEPEDENAKGAQHE